MKGIHKAVLKTIVLLAVILFVSLIAPWMLSQPDTITSIAALALIVITAYVTIAVALPSIIKNITKGEVV